MDRKITKSFKQSRLRKMSNIHTPMIPLSVLLLTIGSLDASTIGENAPSCESSPSVYCTSSLSQNIEQTLRKVSEGLAYLSAATLFRSAAVLTQVGGKLCAIFLPTCSFGRECQLLSHVCNRLSERFFSQMFQGMLSSTFLNGTPFSQSSWYFNQALLSQIPAFAQEDKELLSFLQERWLAKSTGCYPLLIDWIYPCFGVLVQVHPKTTNSYARDPWNKCSQTYSDKVEHWKKLLPHPHHFPLVLTRPSAVVDYLPSYLEVSQEELMATTIDRLLCKMKTAPSKVILDLTPLFEEKDTFPKVWQSFEANLSKSCKEHSIPIDHILCIQRLQQKQIGGIRLLPLQSVPEEEVAQQHQFLLKWISKCGLSANRIELDRWGSPSTLANAAFEKAFLPSKKELFASIAYITSFGEHWHSDHPQKALMVKGTLHAIEGLFSHVSEQRWEEVLSNPTQANVVQLSCLTIQRHFEQMMEEKEETLFYDTVAHLEQVHAHLTALLEILSPFTFWDFSLIYKNLLTCVPEDLKPLAAYGIHSSGMTSLAGIFKTLEKAIEKTPRVLYGENTYFEIIHLAEMISNATPIDQATPSDWKEADLILAQFYPVLKRIDFEVTGYQVENIAQTLRTALSARNGQPLTLALDCTLDLINSSRTEQLLEEFKKPIQEGKLNIVCYRSGLKFDLFGMDNYCSAPIYTLHNADPKWAAFDKLLNDPALQTDPLSINWASLAYKCAANELELYQKQVFDNTRAFLNRIPPRMLQNNTSYRVIPVDKEAKAVFVDIKIFGTWHELRASALGGFLTLKLIEEGHPVFYRPSLGFYHPNFSILYSEKCSTIRLTLGLDPSQVEVLAKCFETIDGIESGL